MTSTNNSRRTATQTLTVEIPEDELIKCIHKYEKGSSINDALASCLQAREAFYQLLQSNGCRRQRKTVGNVPDGLWDNRVLAALQGGEPMKSIAKREKCSLARIHAAVARALESRTIR